MPVEYKKIMEQMKSTKSKERPLITRMAACILGKSQAFSTQKAMDELGYIQGFEKQIAKFERQSEMRNS